MTPREEQLQTALEYALEEMEDMVTYVPEYFREKWGYDASIEFVRTVVARA